MRIESFRLGRFPNRCATSPYAGTIPSPRSYGIRWMCALFVFLSVLLHAGDSACGDHVQTGTVYVISDDPADPQRTPWPGVLVTDGYGFTETDEQGRFSLALAPEARTVSFLNPQGTMPSGNRFVLLPSDRENLAPVIFTARIVPHLDDHPFTFVQQ